MAFAKLGALVAIVGLTALPFASCGGVDFMGHELLRNKPPDTERVGKDLLGPMASFGGERSVTPEVRPDSESLFEGDDRWLHWLYVGLAALALLALVLPARPGIAVLGLLGAGGTVAFLHFFEKRLLAEAPKDGSSGDAGAGLFRSMVSLGWEAGAYVTLAGFGLVALAPFLRLPAPRPSTS
jgi:hypothetical protein